MKKLVMTAMVIGLAVMASPVANSESGGGEIFFPPTFARPNTACDFSQTQPSPTETQPVPTQTQPVPTPTIDAEWELFTQIVACEADPKWGYEGALDVATVIMNRVATGEWGNTITSVVSAYDKRTGVYQFSTYPIRNQGVPTSFELDACRDVLNGKRSLPSTVLFFCTPNSYNKSSFFQRLKVVARRNGHVFCANK